jgi:hypothetical protein
MTGGEWLKVGPWAEELSGMTSPLGAGAGGVGRTWQQTKTLSQTQLHHAEAPAPKRKNPTRGLFSQLRNLAQGVFRAYPIPRTVRMMP